MTFLIITLVTGVLTYSDVFVETRNAMMFLFMVSLILFVISAISRAVQCEKKPTK